MAKLHVELVTAEGRVLSQEADFVLAPGAAGDLGVLPQHIPLLTPLRTGEVMVRNDGVEEFLFVSGGVLEVLPDRVVILADAAERAEDIDQARAEAAAQGRRGGAGRERRGRHGRGQAGASPVSPPGGRGAPAAPGPRLPGGVVAGGRC